MVQLRLTRARKTRSGLDLDVNAWRQFQPHQRIQRLFSRLYNINKSLVRTHFELLSRALIYVRTAQYRKPGDLRRKRNRTGHLCPGAFNRFDDLGGRTVEQGVIRSEEHTSELQSRGHLVCRLLLEKKKRKTE